MLKKVYVITIGNQIVMVFILYFLFWLIYFSNVWLKAISTGPEGWFAAYIPHWADGAAHLSYMASIAYRSFFPTAHPLFVGQSFSYSFAADYVGGLLVKFGLSLPAAYNFLGLFLSLMLVYALWYFLRALLQSSSKTLLATSLFFFSGGLGWKYLFISPPSAPDNFFFSLLTQVKDTDIVWLNTIVGELIPQRSFLLGLPLGLFLLLVFIRRLIYGLPVSRPGLFFSGCLLGLMPIIHPHTAMVLGSVLVFYAVLTRRRLFGDLLYLGFPALIIGFLIYTRFIAPAVSGGFTSFSPGWLAPKTNTNWLIFWLNNWGLFLPLALWGTFRSNRRHQLILLPFWLWFILANLFLFQPYDWDNSKIFTWIYLLFCLPVVNLLSWLFHKQFAHKLIAVVLVVGLTVSGAIDASRMLDTHTHRLLLLNPEELVLAGFVRQSTPDSAVILTSTTHRNWVPIATGRQILVGYLGWMWTYGIDADTRVSDMRAIYSGSPQAEMLIKRYGITHIIIGPEELAEFKVNPGFFADRYPVLYQTATTTIYQVN